MSGIGLSGKGPLGKAKIKTLNSDSSKGESPVAAKQAESAREYLKRAAGIYEIKGHLPGSDGPMVPALKKKYNGGQVLVFVMGAFVEMSGGVSRIRDNIAHELTWTNASYNNGDSERTKGM